MRFKPVEERFAAKYDVDPVSGCWNWKGSKVTGGYGMLGAGPGKGNVLAHRFAYAHFIAPIPEGGQVGHDCDNPPCVNPKHLFCGSHQKNMADMEAKWRARLLTAEEVKAAAACRAAGASYYKIGEMFGVHRMTIARALEKAAAGDVAPVRSRPLAHTSKRPGKLSAEDKDVILDLLAKGETVMAIAFMFNVDRKTIRNVRGLPPPI